MLVFCFFTTFVCKVYVEWIALFVAEFFRINSSMIILRLGYHWLHSQARYLKQAIIERELHNPYERDQSYTSQRSEFSTNGSDSRQDALQIVKLATEIEDLWPTYWYAPNIRSLITQNLFVITFVATLEQLVKASRKINGPEK